MTETNTSSLADATIRGSKMLLAYRQVAGACATAESLMADVLAAVQAGAGWRLAAAADGADLSETTEAADDAVAEAVEIFERMVCAAIDAA